MLRLQSPDITCEDLPSDESQQVGYVASIVTILCFSLLLTYTGDSSHGASIHVLDDDSLINIFYLYRPVVSDRVGEDGNIMLLEQWDHERWWYELVHVCRRWRNLVLGSASHLGLCLLCTHGTPVADMLAHSPPLPLIIDHLSSDYDLFAEDEEDILLALQHRDRVRRIRLRMPAWDLQRLLISIDEEFPRLEYLQIWNVTSDNTPLILPTTLQAPQLRVLLLDSVIYPMGSQLFMTATGLVTLLLDTVPLSSSLSPSDLLVWLSLLPQLEIFGVSFPSPTPDPVVEEQLLHMPTITLPKLRRFTFKGSSAYLEALLLRLTIPVLRRLQVGFFSQPTISIPHLEQFMMATEQLKFNCARLIFGVDLVSIAMYPLGWVETEPFLTEVHCGLLTPQVVSIIQILTALGTAFSNVENLTVEYSGGLSGLYCRQPARPQWRELWRPFRNVKVLSVPKDFIWVFAHSLQPAVGESPMDLLPELKKLLYPADSDKADGNPFGAFSDARQSAGHPFTLVRHDIYSVVGFSNVIKL
jgi:hypothetical protein